MTAIHSYDPLTIELTDNQRAASTAPVRSARLYSNDESTQFHGVWEAEPGVHDDYLGQETVVILRGRATITGSSGHTVDVQAGDLVIIDPGEKTTWTVHETIRKVFVVNPPDATG
ncbi:hypothetical protein OPAG_09272 [Rhodococcus opacus PD630]|uniref:cupin domain-containing protein n=1 Tax=Rhodococcus opacus TaxID=37919 RepID=UPI00029CCD83|nr:cupin domain-containing protein [Rhodococcus opacus]AHK35242.1 hypothetical protein Pd630_LPD09002 [Rhodococcus opacus PD630]EHI41401.1 hypothetical protein OPAG_09272 [Rhodococcus opacus PD630]MDA6584198.1 cupin domain-containing protein [Escherichia coli]UDH01581.1 DUF861 domain-containing protein [Rhodococcus opacus PD630]